MTNLRSQKRIAADIIKRGKNGIWVDPENGYKVNLAVTREDIAKLIHDRVIKPRKVVGVSRGRARAQKFKRARGQRRGPGSRKGTKNARTNSKRVWINKIRSQRLYLRRLRDENYITPNSYRTLYQQAKGNYFRSVRFLSNHIRESGIGIKRIPEGKF